MVASRTITVLGMHSSGTSGLMGAFEEAGVFLGEVAQSLQARNGLSIGGLASFEPSLRTTDVRGPDRRISERALRLYQRPRDIAS